MPDVSGHTRIYEAIARSLRDFGYGDVTAQMVRETDEARQNGAGPSEPHGIVSMFANRSLSEAESEGLFDV